jgi:glucosamine-6-phosphate deaminase
VNAESFKVGRATVVVHASLESLAAATAQQAAGVLRGAIAERGVANVMLATGNSQLAFLAALMHGDTSVEWRAVRGFHMDEYIGITGDHPASFRRYMRARVVAKVPLLEFHSIEGDAADPTLEANRYAELLHRFPLDLCVLGIGENGHLAFNDPPVADFDDGLAVKVVSLDEACRRQQVSEGHFASLADVPAQAITVTIPALLAARCVIAIVPEARKAEPVRAALTGPITTACPASILRAHAHVTIHLDTESAAGVPR